jgi:hypothetical protein
MEKIFLHRDSDYNYKYSGIQINREKYNYCLKLDSFVFNVVNKDLPIVYQANLCLKCCKQSFA